MTEIHTNRLAGESSPHLLQHAHNPVDWYPWGDEALTKVTCPSDPTRRAAGGSNAPLPVPTSSTRAPRAKGIRLARRSPNSEKKLGPLSLACCARGRIKYLSFGARSGRSAKGLWRLARYRR